MRKALQCVRNEYEDIVKEIEGDLDELRWRGTVIQIPAFSEEVNNKTLATHFEQTFWD